MVDSTISLGLLAISNIYLLLAVVALRCRIHELMMMREELTKMEFREMIWEIYIFVL
jgi:hypothetical protein